MAAIHCPEGCFLPFVGRKGEELLASAHLLKICMKREGQVCLCFHMSFCSHNVSPFLEDTASLVSDSGVTCCTFLKQFVLNSVGSLVRGEWGVRKGAGRF